MIELYKHITDSATNFIVFMVFVLAIYLGFAVMISYITDHIIKIIAVIRTPFPKNYTVSTEDTNKDE